MPDDKYGGLTLRRGDLMGSPEPAPALHITPPGVTFKTVNSTGPSEQTLMWKTQRAAPACTCVSLACAHLWAENITPLNPDPPPPFCKQGSTSQRPCPSSADSGRAPCHCADCCWGFMPAPSSFPKKGPTWGHLGGLVSECLPPPQQTPRVAMGSHVCPWDVCAPPPPPQGSHRVPCHPSAHGYTHC